MTVSNTIPVPETTPIYIGTDGGGPDTVFIIDNFKKIGKISKIVGHEKTVKRYSMEKNQKRMEDFGIGRPGTGITF